MGGDKRTEMPVEALLGSTTDLPSDHPDFQRQKIHLNNLEMAATSDVLPNGMASRLGWTQKKIEQLAKRQREKGFYRFLLQVLIQDVLDRIDALMQFHQEEMERLFLEIAEEQDALDQLEEAHLALQDVIEEYGRSGELMIDNSARQAINAYEVRTGEEVGHPDYDAILEIDAQTSELATELRMLLLRKQAEYDHHSEQVANLKEMKEQVREAENTASLEGFLSKLEQHEMDKQPDQSEIGEQLSKLFQSHESDDIELERAPSGVSHTTPLNTKVTPLSGVFSLASENKIQETKPASEPLSPVNIPVTLGG